MDQIAGREPAPAAARKPRVRKARPTKAAEGPPRTQSAASARGGDESAVAAVAGVPLTHPD
jgi:hypothetical protein